MKRVRSNILTVVDDDKFSDYKRELEEIVAKYSVGGTETSKVSSTSTRDLSKTTPNKKYKSGKVFKVRDTNSYILILSINNTYMQSMLLSKDGLDIVKMGMSLPFMMGSLIYLNIKHKNEVWCALDSYNRIFKENLDDEDPNFTFKLDDHLEFVEELNKNLVAKLIILTTSES